MTIAESPPLNVAIEDLVRGAYGFNELRVQRVLQGGMFAQPALLSTDRGMFLLRVHTFRGTESAFQFQAETIESAWLAGLPCSRVQPTQNGAWCVPSTSPRSVIALHRFVEGRCDDWTDWHRRKQSQSGFLHALGQRVAELHNALEAAQPGGDASLDSTLPPIQFNRLNEQFAAWRRDMECLQREFNLACAETREQLLSLSVCIDAHWRRLLSADAKHQPRLLQRQIVHGDISPVNIVFDAEDRPAFIDWDCVHCGLRLYDALGDVLNRPPGDSPEWNRFSKDNVDEYLDGYATDLARPLTELELELVPTFCLARQLEDLRQRLFNLSRLDASQDALYARLISMRVDMMDQIMLN